MAPRGTRDASSGLVCVLSESVGRLHFDWAVLYVANVGRVVGSDCCSGSRYHLVVLL